MDSYPSVAAAHVSSSQRNADGMASVSRLLPVAARPRSRCRRGSAAYQASHAAERGSVYKADRLALVGTPGVGKRSLVMLVSLWLAVAQKRDVALFQPSGYSVDRVVLLSGTTGRYYEWERGASYREIVQVLRQATGFKRVWVAVAPLSSTTFHMYMQKKLNFDLMSAIGEINLADGSVNGLRVCLVPLWSKRDLLTLGRMCGLDEETCERRYALAGGGVRHFLSENPTDVEQMIDHAVVRCEDPAAAAARNPFRYMTTTVRYYVYMLTVEDVASQLDYVQRLRWREVVTSEYARRHLEERHRQGLKPIRDAWQR